MVVGRATNHWHFENGYTDADFYAEYAASQTLTPTNGLGWLKLLPDGKIINTEENYILCKKWGFWSATRDIFEKLTGEKVEGLWVDKIAWSNLYKLSPDGRNPTVRQQNAQREGAIKLLQTEITVLKPDYLLFIVGKDWFEPFLNSLCEKDSYTKFGRNISRGENKNSIFVEGCGYCSIDHIPLVVSCRPEGRKKALFESAVIESFHTLANRE